MKKSKVLVVPDWTDLIKPIPEQPEDYFTISQITEKVKMSDTSVKQHIRKLKKEGKVDSIRARVESGQVTWVYKIKKD